MIMVSILQFDVTLREMSCTNGDNTDICFCEIGYIRAGIEERMCTMKYFSEGDKFAERYCEKISNMVDYTVEKGGTCMYKCPDYLVWERPNSATWNVMSKTNLGDVAYGQITLEGGESYICMSCNYLETMTVPMKNRISCAEPTVDTFYVDECAYYDEDFHCYECEPGYISVDTTTGDIHHSVCLMPNDFIYDIVDGCNVYTSAGICRECDPGHILSLESLCVSLPSDCSRSDGLCCIECADQNNQRPIENSNCVLCAGCEDGMYLDENTECQPCDGHCLCSSASNKCETCVSGYQKVGTMCLKNVPNCDEIVATEVDDTTKYNCSQCESTDGRPYYFKPSTELTSENIVGACVACPESTISCFYHSSKSDTGVVQDQTQCKPGYYFQMYDRVTIGQCTRCVDKCLKCASQTCDMCAEGFYGEACAQCDSFSTDIACLGTCPANDITEEACKCLIGESYRQCNKNQLCSENNLSCICKSGMVCSNDFTQTSNCESCVSSCSNDITANCVCADGFCTGICTKGHCIDKCDDIHCVKCENQFCRECDAGYSLKGGKCDKGLSQSLIIGVSVGAAIILIVLIVVILLLVRQQKIKKLKLPKVKSKDNTGKKKTSKITRLAKENDDLLFTVPGNGNAGNKNPKKAMKGQKLKPMVLEKTKEFDLYV